MSLRLLLCGMCCAFGSTSSFADDYPPLAVISIAGNGHRELGPASGIGGELPLADPFGVEIGPDGALYMASVGHHRVLRLDRTTGRVSTIAGTGTAGYSGDGGPALQAQLNEPYELRFDAEGNLFVVEMKNHVVRRIDAKTQQITTVAGTGQAGFGGDEGPAVAAQFERPHSIALDDQGRIYVADIGNHRIRRIDPDGRVQTIAGNGKRQLPIDGQLAAGNPVLGPRALYCKGQTLWVALREGHSIWTLDLQSGRWQHVAGTGQRGNTGDNGDAKQATMNGPKGIAVDHLDRTFVVDTENHAIRMIVEGRISTVAGGTVPDEAIQASSTPIDQLNRPHGVCVDDAGRVYVGDTLTHRVKMLIQPLRVGIIGLDTSHVIAFTNLLNAANPAPLLAGCRVTAAYPPGSPDIESSVSRRDRYTNDLRTNHQVKMVESIAELLEQVDVVLLESNDGRPHLTQAIPVLAAGKPVFIDKPLAGNLQEAAEIFAWARHYGTPIFSSSSLRYGSTTQAVRKGSVGKVTGCQTYSPCPLEPTHPDLFWYGIHGVESLFTVMGPGCERVTRTKSDSVDLVTGTWNDGRIGSFTGLRAPNKTGYGGTAFGTAGIASVGTSDGYLPLLIEVAEFFRRRTAPVAERETLEIYAFMQAADVSQERGGAEVNLTELIEQAEQAARQAVAAQKSTASRTRNR